MKILIVSHDSGGAEILSSWVKTRKEDIFQYVLEGPAINIFRKKLIDIKIKKFRTINNLILQNDLIITGTSSESKIEKITIKKSLLLNKKIITFVDYWYAFKNRFLLKGKLSFPNEVWVFDQPAYKIAIRYKKYTKVLLKKNFYISQLLKFKNKKNINNKKNLIYLCQPYKEKIIKKNFKKIIDDLDCLDFFFKKVIKYRLNNLNILIRLHPAQLNNRYVNLIKKYEKKLNIKISNNTLSHDLNWGSIAVGMHTNALYVALQFNLKTYHCIPPGSKKCILPFKEIKNFNFKKNIDFINLF